jgi:hypothetical protein
MKRGILCLIFLLSGLLLMGQKVVEDFSEVKKPKEGKLYFATKNQQLSVFLKDGFRQVSKFDIQEPTQEPQDPDLSRPDIVVGYWDDPSRILKLRWLVDGYYLIQTDEGENYLVPRGKNLLLDKRSKINTDLSKIEIRSGDSELGGLYPADNFPSDVLKQRGYKLNSAGEWSLKPTTPNNNSGGKEGRNILPSYNLPSGNNQTDWEQFSDLNIPGGILNVGGYGFPLFKNEGLQNGKLNLFSKGWTHLVNLNAHPRSVWDGRNSYGFNQLQYLIKVAARSMISSGKNGGEWGDIAAIANLPNDEFHIPYENVTIKGAIELGVHLWYTNCCGNSIDNQQWDIMQNEAVLMVDEESMTPLQWPGGDHYSFMGYLNQGMTSAAGPNFKVFWYAQPIQRWYQNIVLKDISTISKLEIEGSFNERNILMNSPGWKNSSWYVDANGAYAKVPFLSRVNIYEKLGGNFLLDNNGRRVFRKDDFTVKIFNREFSILKQPHEWIKYSIQDSWSGQMRFGAQYFDIGPSGAKIKDEYVRQGYVLPHNGLARPNPSGWEPESKLWVDGIYRRADGIMADLLFLAKLEKGKYDISKANKKYKLYGENRPQTEPWTFGGNAIDVREVGENQIFYDTFMLLLSGGQALSTWDDGYYKSELPDKGSRLYDKDDYYGRYHARLAAVQAVLKPLEGSAVEDWTYIHFYYPYWGQKHSEVISSGIYYKDKFIVFFLNPTLENGEKQNLTLEVAGENFTVQLDGHEVALKIFDLRQGIPPSSFKLSYETIYGRNVKVNGVVTDQIDDHYE